MDTLQISTAIKEWRQKNKVSQTGLAKMLGVAKFTVHRWEHLHVSVSPMARKALESIGIITTETKP